MRTLSARFLLAGVVAGLISFASGAVADSLRQGRHVVIVVWDGMRPDFVSEQNTPTLWKLAQSGVAFRNRHPVYPSATIVNGAAIVTGDYPSHDGILANHLYRSDINNRNSIDVETAPVVRNGAK